MDPATILLFIQLAGQFEEVAVKLIAEIKAEKGLTDEQLLAGVATEDQATRDRVAAFLAKLPPTVATPALDQATGTQA